MKKRLLFRNSLFFLALYFFLVSCKSGTQISHGDSLKIKAWNKLFEGKTPQKTGRKPFDKPVKSALATDCINNYRDMYETSPQHPRPTGLSLTSYTWAVSFESQALSSWLTSITTNPNIKMNNIRVCFGLYTQAIIDDNSGELGSEKLNRMTVFLWPYLDDKPAVMTSQTGAKGDTPVDPFNLGSLYP